MWFLYAVGSLMAWATSDLFYKMGANKDDQYSHLKTGIMVGLVMGIHATFYLLTGNIEFNISYLVKYLPVSFFYIASMVIGYKGLRYIELSIASPIQNCSGIITALLLLVIFKESMAELDIVGMILMSIGVVYLSYLERCKERKATNNLIKVAGLTAIVFPLIYCVLDGMGTFLDAIYLDKLSLLSEDAALLAYEYTFFLYGVGLFIYLSFFKKEKIKLGQEKEKLVAAIFETIGQFFYVFALSGNSTFACPIVAAYSMGSVLLSRIFLKEKLTLREYFALMLVIIGIIILGISEGLAN